MWHIDQVHVGLLYLLTSDLVSSRFNTTEVTHARTLAPFGRPQLAGAG